MVQNVVNEKPTSEVILKVPIFASKEDILHDDENAGKTCLGRTWPEFRPFQILHKNTDLARFHQGWSGCHQFVQSKIILISYGRIMPGTVRSSPEKRLRLSLLVRH